MKSIFSLIALAAFGAAAGAQNMSVTAEFVEKEAKPGQTVTLKITVKLDKDWHTYPTVQPDKSAASYVNKISFTEKSPFVPVDAVKEPADPDVKDDSALSITGMHEYPGGGTWERKIVIDPAATAGEQTMDLRMNVTFCNDKGCKSEKTNLKAKLKITGEPVPVDAKYKEEVAKVLKAAGSKK